MFRFLFRLARRSRRRKSNYWPSAPTTFTTSSNNLNPAGKIKAQSNIQIENLSEAYVQWVMDGDTVAVTNRSHEMTIRLDSIDCPEDGQEWGDTAKYALIKMIGRQNVRLEVHGIDPYGRTLATLYVWHHKKNEWTNVNERMVMLGHAWVMRMFYDHLPEDRQDKLNSLERWAKSKKMGLWNTENPVPPWEWRKASGQQGTS